MPSKFGNKTIHRQINSQSVKSQTSQLVEMSDLKFATPINNPDLQ